ncbi:AAA ATPase family protein [Abortiporus biennis]
MNNPSLLFGALRTQLRTPKPSLHPLLQFRSLSSNVPSALSLLRVHHGYKLPKQSVASLLVVGTRQLSLGSIFAPRKPLPTPPPAVVANIATLEAEANANPRDVEKQIALFKALLATNVEAGYEVIIGRWQRMLAWDLDNPLVKSDEAFEIYLTALTKKGLDTMVADAVKRRDILLAQPAASEVTTDSTSTPTDSVSTSSASTVANSYSPEGSVADLVTPSASVPSSSSTVSPSASEKIAQSVLARKNVEISPDLNKLASVLSAGSGVPGNPLVVTLAEPKGSWVPSLARFLVITVVTGFFMLVVLAVLLENSGLIKAGPRQSEFEPVQGKTYKFSDVHGVDEAKDELQEVVQFLKNPAEFTTLGGKLPKGILLTGPPGTGKTMLARAVAGEAGVPFLFASGSEFDEMFVGVGAKRVRELFAAARKKQPAIIFIDELDAIGGKRSNRDQHYMKQTLNQLLVEMDGFLQNEGVIVIAATNFPDSLDPALVRPGRFDRHIAVPLPDVRGRVQILKHHMKGVVTEAGVDPSILARGTPGFSGADLQNMVNQAAVQASREGASAVSLKHFEWAKDRIVMGAERRSTYISDDVKKVTAYHEGGHALVALYTEGAMPLHKVTCVPRGHALGVTSQLPEDDRHSVSFEEYLADIDVCMGGRVAEELIYGARKVTSGCSSDLRHASAVARQMVKNFGFSQKIGPVYYSDRTEGVSPQKLDEIESEVRKLLVAGESRVSTLLKSKEAELHRLATALMERETLTAEEVKKVIKGEPIADIQEVIKEDLSREGSTSTTTTPVSASSSS